MTGYGVSPIELLACEAMLDGIVYLDEFTYSAVWGLGVLGPLLTVPIQIQINGDSDFVAQEWNIQAVNDSDEIDPSPNILITVTRAGAGREVMNQPQPITNMLGNYWAANYPGRKPMPGLYNAANIITVTLQNLTVTPWHRIDVSFIGFKVFYITNADGKTGDRRQVFHAL